MADISLDGAAKGTGIGRRLGLVAERIVWPLLTLAVALTRTLPHRPRCISCTGSTVVTRRAG